MAAVVMIAALAVHLTQAPAPAHSVTMNSPSPGAPGGVFASGTADGRPWRLAVRNIAADPGTRWCLPAVMLNGRDGNVLFKTEPGTPSFGNPAFLYNIPGMPGIALVFTQVGPQVTRLVATWADGRHLNVRPVWVSACTQRLHLAGFAYADPRRGPSELATYNSFGLDGGLVPNPAGSTARTTPGVWQNWDTSRADLLASQAASLVGAGTVNGMTWRITTSLGLFGQCYAATLRGSGGAGRSRECVPVAAPPRTIALVRVPVPAARSELAGYAGLVSPRAGRLIVTLSNGSIPPVWPVNVAGRAYVAFVVPPGCRVTRLTVLDLGGNALASITALPRPR